MFRTHLKEFVVNDNLPGYILTGKVLIKPSVEEVKENSVLFNSIPKEEPIDIIVFATGYNFAFPFLDETVVKVEDSQASFYKYIFLAHLQKPTLAVIGFIKPLSSIIPMVEVQARWAVRVLKGKSMGRCDQLAMLFWILETLRPSLAPFQNNGIFKSRVHSIVPRITLS